MRIILSFLTLSFCLSCAPASHMSGAESEPDRRTEQAGSTLSFIGATSRDMMLALIAQETRSLLPCWNVDNSSRRFESLCHRLIL